MMWHFLNIIKVYILMCKDVYEHPTKQLKARYKENYTNDLIKKKISKGTNILQHGDIIKRKILRKISHLLTASGRVSL